MNTEIKEYIDSKFAETNLKIDNLLSLLERMRSNEIRILMYSQLNARILNTQLYLEYLKSISYANMSDIYDILENDPQYKKAHPIVKNCSTDLSKLVKLKSKARKDLLDDEFTKSLEFIGGIDESLL